MSDGLVKLMEVAYSSEAHVIASYLKSHGIETFLFDVNMNQMYLGFSNVRIMVLKSDLEDAQKYIAEMEK